MRKYEDLTDSEKNEIMKLGLNEEQTKALIKYVQSDEFKKAICVIWETISEFLIILQNALNNFLESDGAKQLINTLQLTSNEIKTMKRNTKGKKMKPWEKKKFYQ